MRSQIPSRAPREISATIQEAFRQAVSLHQQGRLAEAELIYQDILRQEPAFFEALHLLGVVALQTRKTQESVELITKAIARNPNLDLLITVDTSTAHLAGALGKPVWILNRFDTCWRWLLERTDSPWYPTAKLYRQEKGEDWDNVVERVKTDLADFQPGAA